MEGERVGRVSQFICVSDHQQGEHSLSDVESVPPVVVGDPPVAFTERVYEPHQGLQNTQFSAFNLRLHDSEKKKSVNNHQCKVLLNRTLLFNFSIPSFQLQIAAPSQILASANNYRHTNTYDFVREKNIHFYVWFNAACPSITSQQPQKLNSEMPAQQCLFLSLYPQITKLFKFCFRHHVYVCI